MSTKKALLVPVSIVVGVAVLTAGCARSTPSSVASGAVLPAEATAAGPAGSSSSDDGRPGLFNSSRATPLSNGLTAESGADDPADSTTGDAGPERGDASLPGVPLGGDRDRSSGSTTTTTAGHPASSTTTTPPSSPRPSDPPSDGHHEEPVQSPPKFLDFSVSSVTQCPTTGSVSYEEVTVSWDVTGADEVYLAIDNEYGPYETGLPAKASLVVPGPGCSEPNDYYVVASNAAGRTVKHARRSAMPDPEPTEPPTEEPVSTPPKILSFSVSPVEPCESPNDPPPGPVSVSWQVEGADQLYLAIDNEYGPYESGLSATGTLEAPGPQCTDDNTYYLVAENDAGRVSTHKVRTGQP